MASQTTRTSLSGSVEYLSRSESRVAILSALRGHPRPREELDEITSASRVTVDRVLDEFENRGWIERRNDQLRPTPTGRFLAAELDRFRNRLSDSSGPTESREGATEESPTETVAFLSRSEPRRSVLEAICRSPRTRDELKGEIDASHASLNRVLGELDDRGWIDRTNHTCRPTERGETVDDAYSCLLSNLRAADSLAGVFQWLPTERFDFDLHCLGDADVVSADWDDPTRSIHYVAEYVRDADDVTIVGSGAAREIVAAIRDVTVERDATVEIVTDERTMEMVLSDESLSDQFRDIAGSEQATVACHDTALPLFVVVLVDGSLLLCGSEGEAPAHEMIESGDERVCEWASSYVEASMAAAEPLEPSDFTP